MAQCQLCKREFGRLKFVTEHIKVCTRCVSSLNEFSEPAVHAQNRLGDMLARGMERNALRDLDVDFRAILTPVFHPILTPPVGV